MAMVFNKITKSWEDDGTGEGVAPAVPGVPAVPPPAGPAAIAPPPSMAGGGGSGESTLNVTVAQPPRPGWETKQGSRTVVESPQEQSAVTNLALKGGALATAKEAETDVGVREDEINAGLAGKERQLSQDEQARLQQEEAQYQRDLQARGAQERELIEKAARSKIKAGRAKLDMWEGNTLGGFISAIVRSVAAAEHARQGKDGLSPAERILIENANNFEAALVAKAEADKEMRDLYIADRPRWQAAMDYVRKFAADTNARNIKIAGLAAKEAIAKLAPEKRQGAAATAQAAEEKADAENEVKRTQGLRKVSDWEKTEREKETGPGGETPAGIEVKDLPGNVVRVAKNAADVKSIIDKRGNVLAMNKLLDKLEEQVNAAGWVGGKLPGDVRETITRTLDDYASIFSVSRGQGANAEAEAARRIDTLRASLNGDKKTFTKKVRSEQQNNEEFYNSHLSNYTEKGFKPESIVKKDAPTTVSTVSDADLQKAYTNAVKTNSPKKDAIAREISRRAKAKQGKTAEPVSQEEAAP